MKVENISESEQFFVSPDLPSWVRIIFNMKDLYLCYELQLFYNSLVVRFECCM